METLADPIKPILFTQHGLIVAMNANGLPILALWQPVMTLSVPQSSRRCICCCTGQETDAGDPI